MRSSNLWLALWAFEADLISMKATVADTLVKLQLTTSLITLLLLLMQRALNLVLLPVLLLLLLQLIADEANDTIPKLDKSSKASLEYCRWLWADEGVGAPSSDVEESNRFG